MVRFQWDGLRGDEGLRVAVRSPSSPQHHVDPDHPALARRAARQGYLVLLKYHAKAL